MSKVAVDTYKCIMRSILYTCPKCRAGKGVLCYRPHHNKPGQWSKRPRKYPHDARVVKAKLTEK